MEAKEQRRQMSPEGEEENEASLSLPCGRQKWVGTYWVDITLCEQYLCPANLPFLTAHSVGDV